MKTLENTFEETLSKKLKTLNSEIMERRVSPADDKRRKANEIRKIMYERKNSANQYSQVVDDIMKKRHKSIRYGNNHSTLVVSK